ncbi:hypothetical protein GM661_16955 [Iocasia frigidifontis]|uniref:NADH dehydrogenase subunit 4L n=1 Tax=Iocasia fonsfrigidae TaxID=2682810 RepID=A0A8A7KI98_9FIRM|nr:DUF6804 family protein [Iocasia fonsfrigidae]MTI61451.1 hypothetical protein [Bacillota bacterium]QTL99518.1 hypothetical protein GM661_16955 [Iocasia fonsfrigidae]
MKKILLITNIITIVLFILVLTNSLYEYSILEWTVLITAVLNIFVFYKKNNKLLLLLFTVIAVIFNPFTYVSFSHDIKTVVEIASAVIYAYALI